MGKYPSVLLQIQEIRKDFHNNSSFLIPNSSLINYPFTDPTVSPATTYRWKKG